MEGEFGGLEVSDATRLRALEDEMPAEEAAGRSDARQCGLEGSGVKKMVRRREAGRGRPCPGTVWAERASACQLVGIARRVARYVPTRPDDAELRSRLRVLAGERRLGYLLGREGIAPNHKKLLRIYREEGLRSGGAAAQAGIGNQGADDTAARA